MRGFRARGTQAQSGRSNQQARKDDAIVTLIEGLQGTSLETLSHNAVPLRQFGIQDLRRSLPLDVIRWAVWEMEAMNFRHALILMDQHHRARLWNREENTREVSIHHDAWADQSHFDMDWETRDQRRVRLLQELSQLWGGEAPFSVDPSQPPGGLFAPDWQERRVALRLLRLYLTKWTGRNVGIGLENVEDETPEGFATLERALAREFTRLYWITFNRVAPIPRLRPPYPGAASPAVRPGFSSAPVSSSDLRGNDGPLTPANPQSPFQSQPQPRSSEEPQHLVASTSSLETRSNGQQMDEEIGAEVARNLQHNFNVLDHGYDPYSDDAAQMALDQPESSDDEDEEIWDGKGKGKGKANSSGKRRRY